MTSLRTILKPSTLAIVASLLLQGCYSLPMEQIEDTHQYSARQLIEEWRGYSAGQPLQPVQSNDDYYAPYTPQMISRSATDQPASNQAYYYDPRVDNPIARPSYSAPNVAGQDSPNGYNQNITNGGVTNNLLLAY